MNQNYAQQTPKNRKKAWVPTVATVLIIVICSSIYFGVAFFYDPLAKCDWKVGEVFTLEPFAHISHYDPELANEESEMIHGFSKQINVICRAEKGVIVFEDLNDGSVYEGTYRRVTQGNFFGRNASITYEVCFGELEGLLNISGGTGVTNLTIDNQIIYLDEIQK